MTSKKTRQWSWALYDWANSSFATTVMAGFFPLFFQKYWSLGNDPTLTTARLGLSISIASITMAILAPLLGAVADARASKKLMLGTFLCLGLSCTTLLAFIPQGFWWMACICYGLGLIGFNASNVFYDSLLPHITHGSETDRVSSLGYSLGYLGGGILFLINVLTYLNAEKMGLTQTQAVQWSFLSVSLWWGFFSLPLFFKVPEPKVKKPSILTNQFKQSFLQLYQTLKHLRQHKSLSLFLLAYWLYIDGVYTVITMAVDYGLALGFSASHMISALLLVQFVGFPFALLFGYLSSKWGCLRLILFALFIYCLVVIWAIQMKSSYEFFLIAAVIGMVQGGVQALSRSLFAKMVPKESSGEYFGFFNLVGKFASIFGPTLVGVGAWVSGNSRAGLGALLILFFIGGLLLTRVKEPERA